MRRVPMPINRRRVLAGGGTLLSSLGMPAQAQVGPKKPKVPIGRDPGGLAVALLGAGVDYLNPEMAARLARDGEGEIIAWDILDDDDRPLERPADRGLIPPPFSGTEMAFEFLRAAPRARLIPVRVQDRNAMALSTHWRSWRRPRRGLPWCSQVVNQQGGLEAICRRRQRGQAPTFVVPAASFLRDMPEAAGAMLKLDTLLVVGSAHKGGSAGDQQVVLRLPPNDIVAPGPSDPSARTVPTKSRFASPPKQSRSRRHRPASFRGPH